MKSLKALTTAAFMLAAVLHTTVHAQADHADDGSPSLRSQSEIFSELNKFGLPLLEIPRQDPCERGGHKPPLILSYSKDTILTHQPPSSNLDDSVFNKSPDDINVYWIHGLNGTVESFKIAANASQYGSLDGTFHARRLTSVVGSNYIGTPNQPAYSEAYGITRASQDWNTIASSLLAGGSLPPHSPHDFIIAHSQGGIVAREWLRNIDESPEVFPDYAHGLVTFGTPHAGAMILNNTRPDLGNKAPAFFNEGCRALGAAAIVPVIQSNFWTRLLISSNMTNTIINSSCNVFSNSIVPYALDNYHKRTTLDYYVGAAFLTQPSASHPSGGLSDYTLKVPVVQFYGEEEQPVMWKFFTSTLNLETDAMDNTQIEFGYDKDNAMQDKVSAMINNFQAEYMICRDNYDYWSNKKCWPYIYPFPICPSCYVTCKLEAEDGMSKNRKLMEAYAPAIKWLSEANDYYLADLVGAKICNPPQKFCVWQYEADCRDPKINPAGVGVPAHHISSTVQYPAQGGTYCPAGSQPVSYSSYPYCCCTGTRTMVGTAYKTNCSYKANDGVVLAESAASNLKVSAHVTHFYCSLNKTNHDQMKNSKATKDALAKLYDGKLGAFFQVNMR